MTFAEYVGNLWGYQKPSLSHLRLFPVIEYGDRKTGNYFFRGVITYDKCSAPSVTVPKTFYWLFPCFFGSGNSMTLSERCLWLDVDTGSEKFKMTAAKPEVPVSQLLYKIPKKFERIPHVLGVGKVNCAIKKARCRNLK